MSYAREEGTLREPQEHYVGDACPGGHGVELTECANCDGFGIAERHDENPLYYGHDLYPCRACYGTGFVRYYEEENTP